ncbi:adenylate/guanylate cyclase domain-containing protein [Kriegella sp. EG-1]|nr:adenylate/guanylate cyclase domain-containing protein [Flavobacteriaceae bacterium EG-1]
MKPKTKRNISRIAPFGIIWLLVGWFVLFTQEAATGNVNVNPNSAISLTFEVFVFASVNVVLVGFIIGAIEMFWLRNLLKKKSFFQNIIYKMFFYMLFFLVLIILLYPIAASIELDVSPLHSEVWQKFRNFLKSLDFYSTIVSLTFSLFLSLFYSEISENLGYGVLMNFFTGKYHKPTVEKRVFMFLDMKSSTTIAEELGHIKYFELLKEYYSDFSNAVIQHYGEVYQYVGDEIVISWEYKNGIAKNNCIQCFFAMKDSLAKKEEWYTRTFGISPTFKAGMHYGEVTTGEIGALKKEIIFTGDVLNTTARIQGLCNEFGADLLISADLNDELEWNTKYNTNSVGYKALRGKENSIELFAITN